MQHNRLHNKSKHFFCLFAIYAFKEWTQWLGNKRGNQLVNPNKKRDRLFAFAGGIGVSAGYELQQE